MPDRSPGPFGRARMPRWCRAASVLRATASRPAVAHADVVGWARMRCQPSTGIRRAAVAARVSVALFTLRPIAPEFDRPARAKRPCVLWCGPGDAHAGFHALHVALHAALWPARLCTSRHAAHDVVLQPPGRTRVKPWRHWNGRTSSFALLHNLRGSAAPSEVLGEWLDAAGTGQ